MIEDHYGHRLARKGNLRAQLLKVMGEGRDGKLPPAGDGSSGAAKGA